MHDIRRSYRRTLRCCVEARRGGSAGHAWCTAVLFTALLAVGGTVPVAHAEDTEPNAFTGTFRLGLRSVDVGGAERKYREDLNLDDGPRLFDLSFVYAPTGEEQRLVDRVDLEARNLGGDPFEHLRLGIRKFGAFTFTYDRRTSSYFYDDLILPVALADPNASNAGDFHTFDFDRVRDTAKLDLRLSERAKLSFGFDRFTKKGESTTTLDISRDEFELDRPIDESLNGYRGSFQYTWPKATLILEEYVRDYENAVEIFLPGFSLGENEGDATTLDFFFLDQPYDFTSFQHTARLLLRPNARMDIQITAQLEDLDLDVEAAERSQGTTFQGTPFSEEAAGAGGIDRDLEQLLVEGSYAITDRVAIVGGVSRRDLDQEGAFLFDDGLNQSAWTVATTGAELGVEWAVHREVTLALGVSQEERDVEVFAADGSFDFLADEEQRTERTGAFALASWRPARHGELSLEVEDDAFDDPFALSSPTDRRRYRLRGRYAWDSGWNLSGAYQLRRDENTNSDWTGDTESLNLRVGFQSSRLAVSAGFSNVSLDREIDQVVVGGFLERLFAIDYEADADFFDARVRYRAHDRLTLGADVRLYQNAGSFGLEREDVRGWVEVGVLERYVLSVAYRVVDYDEDDVDFDDYDADILELGIGYSW